MFAALVGGFNIDTKSAVVHRGIPGSMFGFSVALYRDGSKNGLLVGAPRTQTSQPNVTNGGAVFLCGTDATSDCRIVPFDLSGSNSKVVSNRLHYTDDKSNQWFGATVEASTETGLVVACAPRYVYFSINYQRREPVGNCWIAKNSLANFEEYSPCRTSSWGFHRQGFCQAGFSAAVTENGNRLYVGAPGSWYWQGQVFSHDLTSKKDSRKTKESPANYDDSFMGYSSAAGDFTGDGEIDVVVGMPRGSNLTGKIVLYDQLLHNLQNVSGEQMGSYFGYSVCVSDVNGDGLDDIVVGAPLFTDLDSKESKYEEGRVYVHYQDSLHQFSEDTRDALDGFFVKGRFGLSVASLKDMNRDGYGDFAVGAPYAGKDGNGIIYIYHGSSKGIRDKPSQVITPDDFKDKGLRTLGFSLSGSIDMDSNEYPDIVIGAYDSERVIFMRSRPVVNMTSSMALTKEVLSLEDKTCTLRDKTKVACLEATLCLKYNGIGVAQEIDIKYTFMLDAGQKSSRALFLDEDPYLVSNRTKTLRLKKDTQFCNKTKLYIQNGIRDKLSPIEVTAAYELIDLEPYRFVLKPILNLNEPTSATNQINIEKNCGKDDICIPDLQLYVESNMEQYSIGTKKRLELDVIVRNAGEDAFESMLYVSTPPDVNYVNIDRSKLDFPVSCTPKVMSAAEIEASSVNHLICDIGNPLPANKTLEFKVILEPSRVISSTRDLVFTMIVNSTNVEKNETLFNNMFEIDLPVRVEVSLAVTGISILGVITYNKSEPLPEIKVSERDVGPDVMHVYEVGNRGPSSVQQAEVFILWPTYTLEGNKSLLYPMTQPQISGNAVCEKMEDVNPLNLQEDRPRSRDQNITSEDLTHYLLLHGLKERKLTSPEENLVDEKEIWKRDVGDVDDFMSDEGEDKFFSNQGEGEFEEELSCGPTLCTKIRCTISNLEKGDQVIFRIRSRLWRETYDELGLSEVKTSSKLVTRITALPYGVDPSYLPYKIFVVSTKVILLDGLTSSYMIPWWIIILAVCCGLLLLALLALLLWKLGFFKRKRPQEVPEKEPLNERNGYRMASGDTAL